MPRIDSVRVTRAARVLRALGLCFSSSLLILPALAPAGCGDSTPRCTPGQSIACAGSGCTGHQVCDADGRAYGECQCDDPGSDTFPTVGPNSGLIGAACTSAANCRLGFDCLTADSRLIHGQGPSAGICLAKCLPEHDFCKDLDARSKCIVLSDGGTTDKLDDISYCLPGCKLGTQANELDKCRGRVDLVCSESLVGSGVGYCRPACRSDLDCAGRSCDLSTGLCGDSEPVGDPIGAECNPESLTPTCAGACLPQGGAYAACSGACSYGTPGCGQVDTDLPLESYCYLDPTGSSGAGDLGYCSKLCDCDKDCARPDTVCEPKPALASKTGRSGVCGSKGFSNGTLRPNTPC